MFLTKGKNKKKEGKKMDYVRYSKDPSGMGKDSTNICYMFVEESDEDSVRHYGQYRFVTNEADAVDSETLESEIEKLFKKNPDILEEYQATAEELAADASPDDIVDSAGLWDNPDLVQMIWDEILEPGGVFKVKTPNGMLVFDPALIKADNNF